MSIKCENCEHWGIELTSEECATDDRVCIMGCEPSDCRDYRECAEGSY